MPDPERMESDTRRSLIGALLGLALIVGTLSARSSMANNDACWGDNGRDDISCVKLTEPLLLSLRGVTKEQVQKVMDAPGDVRRADSLHFLSNYDNGNAPGSGYLNVTFEDGRATIIYAEIDASGNSGDMYLVWNAYAAPRLSQEFDPSTRNFARPAYCSDISRQPMPCKGGTTERELMLSKMAFGSAKSELLEMLNASCNIPGIVVSDPDGDCERLRKVLQ